MEPPGPRLAAALARDGVEVGVERAEAAFRAEIAYYLEHHVEGRDEASLADLRDRCARVLWDGLGEPAALLGLRRARAAMLDAIRFHAYPDAAPALRSLRARGLRLVVASNWDCSLPEVLEQAGLAALVDGVVASAAVGADKPAPAVFEAALAGRVRARSRPFTWATPRRGTWRARRRAGIRAVLLDRSGPAGRGGVRSRRQAVTHDHEPRGTAGRTLIAMVRLTSTLGPPPPPPRPRAGRRSPRWPLWLPLAGLACGLTFALLALSVLAAVLCAGGVHNADAGRRASRRRARCSWTCRWW